MRILAVDDDPVVLDMLGTALESSGLDDITFATSAEDALELIEVASRPYDIFLLDVMLPGTSGIEVCRSLRQRPRYRATPVLMITASRAGDMMARAFEAGATDFVSKPFDTLELVTRIRLAAMLGDSRQREAMHADAVGELSQLTEVSFDARFDLKPNAGVKGFLAMENELLRRADALYEVTMFSVQIDNALGFFRGSRPAQFRAGIEAAAAVLSDVLDTDETRFAYAGRGAFIGVGHAHGQIDMGATQRAANAGLAKSWDNFTMGQPTPLTLKLQRIEGPPFWSGKAAADAMRSFQRRPDLAVQADPYEVDGLFKRLSVRISSG
ncbi:response regulator [Sulfitobacter sp. HNIBRBA2951]|uniref:response regulator n=1 Tax=Sulfitobacter aquimarinus TaxID=3158557 RepID=UPI0032E03964